MEQIMEGGRKSGKVFYDSSRLFPLRLIIFLLIDVNGSVIVFVQLWIRLETFLHAHESVHAIRT